MTDPLDAARTFPLFAAPSPASLAHWYRDHLGFPRCADFDDQYAIAVRGDLEIHFWPCRERKIAENTSAYFQLASEEAQDALYEEWSAAADKPGFHPGRVGAPPETFDHGMREFFVHDPAGNLLRFGVNMTRED